MDHSSPHLVQLSLHQPVLHLPTEAFIVPKQDPQDSQPLWSCNDLHEMVCHELLLTQAHDVLQSYWTSSQLDCSLRQPVGMVHKRHLIICPIHSCWSGVAIWILDDAFNLPHHSPALRNHHHLMMWDISLLTSRQGWAGTGKLCAAPQNPAEGLSPAQPAARSPQQLAAGRHCWWWLPQQPA